MPEHDNFYTSAHIDEEVDALLQARGMATRDQRLIADLRDILTNEQEDARSLHNVLHRLFQETGDQPEQAPVSGRQSTQRQSMQGRPLMMRNNDKLHNTRQIKPAVRVLTVLVAVLIIAVVIGSMLAILHTIHQPAGPLSTPMRQNKKTPAPIVNEGKIIYHSASIIDTTPVVWSPDGLRVAAATGGVQSGAQWQISSWDALTGQHVVIYHISDMLMYGARPIATVAWSPDGSSLAAVAFTGKIYIFDARSAALTHTFAPPLALSNPAPLPVAASGKIVNQPLVSLFPQAGRPIALPQMAWSSDGKYLAEGVQGKVLIWDVSTGLPAMSVTDNYSGNMHVLWEPHGKLFAMITCLNTMCPGVFIWNTTIWHLVKQYPNVVSFDWSPDGKQLALVSVDGQNVRIVDAATGRTVKQIVSSAKTQISAIHWSPDGKYMSCREDVKAAGGSVNAEIAIWIA